MKLVIFDLDGTLVDAYTAVQKSMNAALTRHGYDSVDHVTIKKNVGWGERVLVSRFVREEDVDDVLSSFQGHHGEALKRDVVLLDGSVEILTYLRKRGCLLAIGSNRPRIFTDVILDNLDLTDFFDMVLCGDQVAHPKPAPDLLLHILEQSQCLLDEAVYVGDMIVDIQAGQAAQIKTIAVATGSSTKDELEQFEPFSCVSNLNQVKEVLKTL